MDERIEHRCMIHLSLGSQEETKVETERMWNTRQGRKWTGSETSVLDRGTRGVCEGPTQHRVSTF